jgi:HNH endonuclease
MKTIQEIFTGKFKTAKFAVIQKCRSDSNVKWMEQGYTQHWPALPPETNIIALAIGSSGASTREIWVGNLLKQQATIVKKFRFDVDEFVKIGVHDKRLVSDADFYGNGGGGGSRVRVVREGAEMADNAIKAIEVAEGEMVARLVWMRKNHSQFRDPVWTHWQGKCAVTRSECDGLLVASHIKPWSKCDPKQQTDFNNGLLLAASLDSLFDRGFISFSDDGALLINNKTSRKTAAIFGVKMGMKLDPSFVTPQMKKYLKWHRNNFSF